MLPEEMYVDELLHRLIMDHIRELLNRLSTEFKKQKIVLEQNCGPIAGKVSAWTVELMLWRMDLISLQL